jgi:ankyrin repeat protein
MNMNTVYLYLWAIGALIWIFWNVFNNQITKIQNAAKNGDLEQVKKCLEKGVDPDIRTGKYITPIAIATNCGHQDIVELLIEYGADINQGLNEEDGVNPLLAAAINNYSEMEAMYLELGAEIGLHYAVLRGDIERVRNFIDREVSLNSKRNRGMTPLHLAAMGGQRELVELLLDNGADIDFYTEASETPLHQAVRSNHQDIVELLIDRGAKTDCIGKIGTPLNLAIYENNLAMVQLLINKGLDVNFGTRGSSRPVYYSVKKGYIQIAELLIVNGADVNAYEIFEGDTPLHKAAWNNDLDMARLLLRYGANVNSRCRDLSSDTPLHCAKNKGNREMMRLLESYGGLDFGLSE